MHRRVEASLDDLSLLTALASRLDAPLGDVEAIDGLLAALERERGMSMTGLLVVDRAHEQLLLERAPAISGSRRRRVRVPLGRGLAGRVAELGRSRVEISLDPADPMAGLFEGRYERLRLRSHAAVPIKYGPEVVGVLTATFPEGVGRDETWEPLALLQISARMLGASTAALQTRAGQREAEEADHAIRGRSKAIKALLESVRTVAASDTTVLILGESGTGKELVASAIHRASDRKDGPFVRVNCAALPEGVIESELFGHEVGSFTGATRRRVGRFEAAHRGTIFLDEVGDLPAAVQVALLRILQERTVHRVGGNEELSVDVRIIAATHRDLGSAMRSGEFREDLFYRLNVFPIRTPPLRDRRTDIPLLADAFVDKYARAARKRVRRISSRAIDLLMAYHWPGNVRELENCIERAVLLADDQVIHGRHLPPTLQMDISDTAERTGRLEATLAGVERDMLDEALKLTGGNMAEAARQLGLTERKMGLRVKRHQLDPKRHRRGSKVG